MKKINSKKAISITCISLACLCLGGVGLASWIIQSNETKTTSEITIGVASTDNQQVSIEKLTFIDNNIYLDAANGDNVAPIKHVADGEKVEDLTLSFSFNIKKDSFDDFSGVFYRFIDKTNDNSLSSYLNNPASANYILTPGAFIQESEKGDNYYPLVLDELFSAEGEILSSTSYLKANQISSTSIGSESDYNIKVDVSEVAQTGNEPAYIKYVVTLNLKWGDKFGGINPSRYGEGISTALDNNFASSEDVISSIDELKTAINGKAFMIELSHFPTKTAAI